MPYNVYCARHGDVRISEREMIVLETAEIIRRDKERRIDPAFAPTLARAAAIEAACERFAKHKCGG
jgi:hypothetical protein